MRFKAGGVGGAHVARALWIENEAAHIGPQFGGPVDKALLLHAADLHLKSRPSPCQQSPQGQAGRAVFHEGRSDKRGMEASPGRRLKVCPAGHTAGRYPQFARPRRAFADEPQAGFPVHLERRQIAGVHLNDARTAFPGKE